MGAEDAGIPPQPVVDREVKIKLLTGAEPWSLNGPGTSNGLLVVSGAPGSGKSQLALDLLAQLSGQGEGRGKHAMGRNLVGRRATTACLAHSRG